MECIKKYYENQKARQYVSQTTMSLDLHNPATQLPAAINDTPHVS